MKQLLLQFLLFLALNGCGQSQGLQPNKPMTGEKQVGGNCEGCEAIFECPIPFEKLNETDTLADFNSPGPKLKFSGQFFMPDGKTPAPGVIMYFYHTDQKGIYPTRGNEKGWDRKHGYLRGWIKTDENGRYEFYTLRPASYPNSRALAHIHAFIKEPGKSPYYIDDFLFADDPFLADEPPSGRKPRGSTGVITMQKDDSGMQYGKRDIILGLNIPGYE